MLFSFAAKPTRLAKRHPFFPLAVHSSSSSRELYVQTRRRSSSIFFVDRIKSRLPHKGSLSPRSAFMFMRKEQREMSVNKTGIRESKFISFVPPDDVNYEWYLYSRRNEAQIIVVLHSQKRRRFGKRSMMLFCRRPVSRRSGRGRRSFHFFCFLGEVLWRFP